MVQIVIGPPLLFFPFSRIIKIRCSVIGGWCHNLYCKICSRDCMYAVQFQHLLKCQCMQIIQLNVNLSIMLWIWNCLKELSDWGVGEGESSLFLLFIQELQNKTLNSEFCFRKPT